MMVVANYADLSPLTQCLLVGLVVSLAMLGLIMSVWRGA
jgi:hypothetical protein